MINVDDLQFSYDQHGFRLHVENMTVRQGERVTWLGASGCGKSTLLQLVAGILTPRAGRVTVCGTELTDLDDAARRDFRISNVGLVFQEFELLEYLTLLDNVLLPFRINRSCLLTPQARDTAKALIEEVGLADFTNRRPDQLSQGQRQRIAVCRALVTNPKLVLADEPTANLDVENKSRVLDLLDTHVQRTGATLVVVSHDQAAQPYCDRTIDVATFCHHEGAPHA